jgi:hypothetical protein
MSNNPLLYNDPLGDTLRGIDNQDARRTQRIIRKSFQGSGMRDVRNLFKRSGNTFRSIGEKAFAKATANLTPAQKALAKGYKDLINSNRLHTVDVAKRNEKISFASYLAFGPLSAAEFDNTRGGASNKLNETGSHTLLIMDSKAVIGDYTNSNGAYQPHTPAPGENLAHELIGHALGYENNSSTYDHDDAIQASNLYLRATGEMQFHRDGTTHGEPGVGNGGMILFPNQAEAIPAYLQDQ